MIGTETEVNSVGRYGDAPSVLVASDNISGGRIIESALAAIDARIVDSLPLAGLEDRLDRMVSISAVVVHADIGTPAHQLERIGARLNMMATEGAGRGVLIVPASLIDTAFGAAGHSDVQILCQPGPAEVIAAVAMACTTRTSRLNDVAGLADGRRLVQLSEEIGRIARTLATLAESPPTPSMPERVRFAPPPPMTADVAAAAGAQVRALIRARRTRDQFFRNELFADPAWDMLLDLMAARLEHKRVSVSSLCIAAAVPATTALRWIKSMTDEGLFVRRADNNDGRRIFIELSDEASGAMSAYLDWLKVNPAAMV
ncbi:MarR family transcriptional regulator [Tardibacter chloracetimidivorans]|uniref:MarR family transcriptional regulator n=1 Tax=Tardibacter chloracetimidivorans TaxID=1921510 RepID=UPI000AD1BAD0|nr:MarR family transcriptional regulator [Tardibacter chloracetimidivorans]